MEPNACNPAAALNYRPFGVEQGVQRTVIVTDLGYGDAGKGSLTDWLCRHLNAHTVIRYNGGPQAAHTVVTNGGREHTFAQFGSGTFIPGVRTLLSRWMLIEPFALFNEAAHLAQVGITDAFNRLLVDRRTVVITPFHVAANRLREMGRGERRHGSCGLGVGEAVADHLDAPERTLTAADLAHAATVRQRLRAVHEAKWDACAPLLREEWAKPFLADLLQPDAVIDAAVDEYAALARRITLVDADDVQALLHQPGNVVFEGAQGVLLDQDYGFAPYHTWSRTTSANALDLLGETGYPGAVTRIGVLRTYFTRHGAGPFVTEDRTLLPEDAEAHNGDSPWQGRFRVGWLDMLAARYAVSVNGGIDALALTHLDRLTQQDTWQVCRGYRLDKTFASDRDVWFECDGDHIRSIRVCTPPDLTHQTHLTDRLFACQPVYETVPAQPTDYVETIAAALGVPVAITSHGPRPSDKRLR